MTKFHKDGTNPLKTIFVFGSNEAGIHGAGAALAARRFWGAKYGIGWSFYGNSFAIPTKDKNVETLPLNKINDYVDRFNEIVLSDKEHFFFITRIGCGLAGYTDKDIAPMFKPIAHLDNVSFAKEWEKYL